MLSIKEIYNKLSVDIQNRYNLGINWKLIVGDYLSKNSSPAYIKNDTLYVYTFSSAWLHHLSLVKNQILKEIDNIVKLGIKDLKFLMVKKEKDKLNIPNSYNEKKLLEYNISLNLDSIKRSCDKIENLDIRKKFFNIIKLSKIREMTLESNEKVLED